MAFCSFSSEVVAKNSVSIDNKFISEFLPTMPEHCVKVYLYGLFLASNPTNASNTLEDFSRVLNLSEEDVVSSFTHLQILGLVQLLNITPVEVRYLPVQNASATLRKFNKDKFKHFNQQAQELLNARIITPTEYHEFYYTMESLHMEPDAMVMIIKYCVDLKGNDVGYKYILTVAKNWAYEGITTCEKVEERLLTQQAADSDLKLVFAALGVKRTPSVEDYQLFLEMKDQMGFEIPVLVFLAKKAKKQSGGLNRLNYLVNKFYKMRLTSQKEIEEYLQSEEEMFAIAKEVCKNIGVRYDNLEIVVETYVNNWLAQGYDLETLTFLSKHCFTVGIRSLSGLNDLVNQFYKLGLITQESISNHLEQVKKLDQTILEILNKLGIIRQVNQYDRAYYQTWLYTWQISEPLLNYAITLSQNKVQPMQFLNKLLSVYHTKQITTVEQAEKENIDFLGGNKPSKSDSKPNKRARVREYSKEDLNSLFTSITEVEL